MRSSQGPHTHTYIHACHKASAQQARAKPLAARCNQVNLTRSGSRKYQRIVAHIYARVCVCVCAMVVCFSIIYLLTALRRPALSAPVVHQTCLPRSNFTFPAAVAHCGRSNDRISISVFGSAPPSGRWRRKT